jgi:hypothetical protein
MVCASARSEKIFSAVSATMFSLSATAFLVFVRSPQACAGSAQASDAVFSCAA